MAMTSVDGVTSMSADIHKYGYCFKGASIVMTGPTVTVNAGALTII